LTKAPGYYVDQAEAIAAAELQPERSARPVAMVGGLPRSRTLGY
jgi:hypothetical protein